MEYRYGSDREVAMLDSPIFLQDALAVVALGKRLLARFDEHGVETGADSPAPTNEVFEAFHADLYGSGFVVSDFSAPLFDKGCMRLLFIPGVAGLVAQSSNLITLRMFIHTLARGYRATYGFGGYPYFDRAYRSGGLRGILDRLAQYCELARRRGWEHLQEDSELDALHPVEI